MTQHTSLIIDTRLHDLRCILKDNVVVVFVCGRRRSKLLNLEIEKSVIALSWLPLF